MKKKSSKKKSKKLIQRYNDAKAKKNVKVSAMKTGVDLVGGIGLGTLLGSVFGIWSPIIGIIAMGTGHAIGDQSGVIRIAGTSMTAYGLATAIENRTASETSTVDGVSLEGMTDGVKNRLAKLKENWKHALYVDKLLSKTEKETIEKAIDGFGNIDVSSMDAIERIIENSSEQFNRENDNLQLEDTEDELEEQFSSQDYFEDETGEAILINPSVDGIEEENDLSFDNVDFTTM